jgi:hypothetical protein
MKVEHKDFIGVFSDVFPEGFCEHLISEFDRLAEIGVGYNRQETENVGTHIKSDHAMNLNAANLEFDYFNGECPRKLFFSGLQHCFDLYSEQFSVLKSLNINCKNIKLQRVPSGGGYHVWHFEQGNAEQARRGLVYMLYLNTLPPESNGETEFLYQQRRINPVANTMVLWPASFTHTHRGNPVYGDTPKHTVTGWFYHE